MLQHSKHPLVSLLLTTMIAILVSTGCRNHARPGEGESEDNLKGEPDRYSATIVRTTDDGEKRETIITRVVRAGEQRREECTEEGHNRALIWRPDLGKCYLLDLDLQVFVENALGDANGSMNNESDMQDRTSADSPSAFVQAVDRALDDAPSPDRDETRMLPGAEIDGHSCTVNEQRATFPDGHTEITKTFRARDLGGLALRIEAESRPPSVRVITERRDIRLDVAPDAFTVPASFKKVDKIER